MIETTSVGAPANRQSGVGIVRHRERLAADSLPTIRAPDSIAALMAYIPPTANVLGDAGRGHAALKSPAPDSREPPQSKSMHRLKTYIVEDSQVIRESLIATLEELVPVEVIGTAEDEFTAVHWLMQPSHQFDLVIIDIFLKGGSGLGVLRAASGLTQRCKLVVLSNYATQDMRRKCLELGADRVFDKSTEIDALILYCGQLASGETGSTAHGALS
jgi:CheY-like chemotaxis protein